MSEFTLNDFKTQMKRIAYPSLLEQAVRIFMPPEMRRVLADEELQRDTRRTIGVIEAMTPEERRHPKVIDSSRAGRIARGAGVSPSEVHSVLKQHAAMAPVQAMLATTKKRDMVRPVPKR